MTIFPTSEKRGLRIKWDMGSNNGVAPLIFPLQSSKRSQIESQFNYPRDIKCSFTLSFLFLYIVSSIIKFDNRKEKQNNNNDTLIG